MADYIVLTETPFVIPTSAVAYTSAAFPDIRLAVNVARWDILDISVSLIGPSTTQMLTLEFVTGIQNEADDYNWAINWASSPSVALPSPGGSLITFQMTPASAGTSLMAMKTVPGALPLLRFLRWRAWFAGATSASLMITAMGRRRGT